MATSTKRRPRESSFSQVLMYKGESYERVVRPLARDSEGRNALVLVLTGDHPGSVFWSSATRELKECREWDGLRVLSCAMRGVSLDVPAEEVTLLCDEAEKAYKGCKV